MTQKPKQIFLKDFVVTEKSHYKEWQNWIQHQLNIGAWSFDTVHLMFGGVAASSRFMGLMQTKASSKIP